MNITIRDVDAKVFRYFKAETVRADTTLGKAVTMAMKLWLDQAGSERKKKKSILDMKAFDWGKDTESTSTDVDETLYGD